MQASGVKARPNDRPLREVRHRRPGGFSAAMTVFSGRCGAALPLAAMAWAIPASSINKA